MRPPIECKGRFRWSLRLGCGFAGARLLKLRVQIPLVTGMSVSCVCFVLSGRGFSVGLITSPEESYRAWCV